MAWSYNPNLGTSLDIVRFKIGDIETDRQLLDNDTITALLAVYNDNTIRTSVASVRGILAMLARNVNRSVLGVSGSVDQMTMHYRDLLRDLIAEQNTEAGVYSGAISIATAENYDDKNGDTMKSPDFRMGQFDIQNATSSRDIRWYYK